MELSEQLWRRLALASALAGICLLLIGAVGYALGLNETSGLIYGPNIVPMSFFSGLVFLFLSGAFFLARSPQAIGPCPTPLAIGILAAASWFSVAVYVWQMRPLILLRADLAMGSESQFVDHIIRFRAGQPQYTPPEDANTSAYTPGAPLVTYFMARAVGRPTSIPTFRLVQQVYLAIAVFFMAAAAKELFRICRPATRYQNLWLWFWAPFLYLIANNPHTNVYTHVLYSDALALAVDALAFWLLIRHFVTSKDRWLILMAVTPALAFLAKQKEAVWAILYVIYLLLAGRTALRRIVLFGVTAFGLLGLTVAACYAIWGAPFYFWAFKVLYVVHVSLEKILEQVREGGWYVVLGLIGGAILLRGKHLRQLFPVWFCWLLLMAIGIYTSGMAYRPAHLGPGTLVGAVWLLIGLSTIWPGDKDEQQASDRASLWLRTMVVPGAVVLLLVSSGMVRLRRTVPPGMERYLAQIEKEFEGLPRHRVLLDTGSWVYLPENIVMKDRESPLGTEWATGTSDFAMTIERIRTHYYDKILVRKLDTGEFLFRDPRIRRALSESYREIRVIPSPGVPKSGWLYAPLLSQISVLEPAQHSP